MLHKELTNIQIQKLTKTITPITSGVLQRKCTCGQLTITGSESSGCCKNRLHHKTSNHTGHEIVPPIVHEVLRSPGQPLGTETRAYMESRFGHDFSHVRVHTDTQAAESTKAVNALAYTVDHHIAFDTNLYNFSSVKGKQLIAHELTHVVQQSSENNNRTYSFSDHQLEVEANRTASLIAAGNISNTMVASQAQIGLQKQPSRGQQASPQPVAPNSQQRTIIENARRAAAIRCQIAMFRVRGLDSVVRWSRESRSLARIMFEWGNPNMEQIGDVISSMVTFLLSGIPVMVASARDPVCGIRPGYVRGLRPPIILCPNFFSASPEQQIRTMIHEAAHLARIASAGMSESYCIDFDCVTSCGGFDSADSWAHYVHCLSGQTPDQTASTPSTYQRQIPQRSSGGK